jgi:hypothetical protein
LLPTIAVSTAFKRHGSTTRDKGNYGNHIKPHVELPSAQAEFDCRTFDEANACQDISRSSVMKEEICKHIDACEGIVDASLGIYLSATISIISHLAKLRT